MLSFFDCLIYPKGKQLKMLCQNNRILLYFFCLFLPTICLANLNANNGTDNTALNDVIEKILVIVPDDVGKVVTNRCRTDFKCSWYLLNHYLDSLNDHTNSFDAAGSYTTYAGGNGTARNFFGLETPETSFEGLLMLLSLGQNFDLERFEGGQSDIATTTAATGATTMSSTTGYDSTTAFIDHTTVRTISNNYTDLSTYKNTLLEDQPVFPETINQTAIQNTTATAAPTVHETSLFTLDTPGSAPAQQDFDFATCGVFPACTPTPVDIKVFKDQRTIRFLANCDGQLVTLIVAITIILSVVVFFSNLLIIMVTLRTRSMRGFFKLSLAVADMIAGVVVLPSVIYNIFTEINDNLQLYVYLPGLNGIDSNTPAAIICGIAGILSTITAVYSLLLLSIDSFLSITWPVKYRVGDIMSKTRALIAVSVVWVFSLAVAIFPIFATDFIEYRLNYITLQYLPFIKQSTQDSAISGYWLAILYAVFVWGVPFVATWVLTVITLVQSRKMLGEMRLARRHSIRSTNALDKIEQDFHRTVSVVLVLFTLTILPVFVTLVYLVSAPVGVCRSNAVTLAFFITTYVLMCGRFLNVIVYNIFNKQFREAFKKFFDDFFLCITCNDKATRHMSTKSRTSRKIGGTFRSRETITSWKSKLTSRKSTTSVRTASLPSFKNSGFAGPHSPTSGRISNSSADSQRPRAERMSSCNSVFKSTKETT
ncbi:uncharacterized protein LOC143470947 [Clavelina lepadiformis]|uniref:uncharacterized protein LOC143470947 n=1 Tax=Clavelina lepadiformis TaxID=159417 RepID=UPI00404209AB